MAIPPICSGYIDPPVADLIHHLTSRHASADTQDGELLRHFAATGDANAFELLLWRHERMVMGVCDITATAPTRSSCRGTA